MATQVRCISFDPRIDAKLEYYKEQQGVTRSRLVNQAVAQFLGLPYDGKGEEDEHSDQ